MKLSVRSMFSKKDLQPPAMKECWSSTLWLRNVEWANWRNSCIEDGTTVYRQKWSRIM